MTTETKPTPATDEEIRILKESHPRCGRDYCDLVLPLAGGLAPESLLVRVEADRAKILPSSCSISHPEIRYTGETCPLCEALDVLEFYADPGTYAAIGFFPDRPCGAFMDDFSDDHGDEDFGSKPGKRARNTVSALSRPSSAPAPECECIQRQLQRGKDTIQLAHFDDCPVYLAAKAKPAPGDGEVGK